MGRSHTRHSSQTCLFPEVQSFPPHCPNVCMCGCTYATRCLQVTQTPGHTGHRTCPAIHHIRKSRLPPRAPSADDRFRALPHWANSPSLLARVQMLSYNVGARGVPSRLDRGTSLLPWTSALVESACIVTPDRSTPPPLPSVARSGWDRLEFPGLGMHARSVLLISTVPARHDI